MKKLLVFPLFIFLIISCTSGSDGMGTDATLVSKIVRTNESGVPIETVNYTYLGTRFKTISDSNFIRKFFYSGNVITRMKMYDGNDLVNESYYSYDSSGRLIRAKNENIFPEQTLRDTYTYNADHTISVMHYSNIDNSFDPVIGEHLDYTSKYFLDANNEIEKAEDYHTAGTAITTFTQDDKNNPFKNVMGVDKLLQAYSGINFNVVAIDHTGYDEASFEDQVKELTYNADGFPLTMHFQNTSTTEHYY